MRRAAVAEQTIFCLGAVDEALQHVAKAQRNLRAEYAAAVKRARDQMSAEIAAETGRMARELAAQARRLETALAEVQRTLAEVSKAHARERAGSAEVLDLAALRTVN